MSEERNNNQQIIRKDAKGCFVEVLNDSFEIGRVHMFFCHLRRQQTGRKTPNEQRGDLPSYQ